MPILGTTNGIRLKVKNTQKDVELHKNKLFAFRLSKWRIWYTSGKADGTNLKLPGSILGDVKLNQKRLCASTL